MNLANKYVPDYVLENLPWCKRDGLLTWYDQAKCKDFLDNIGEHFEKIKIVKFVISKLTFKDYHTLNHYEVKVKESANSHFLKKTGFGRGEIIKKMGDQIYRESQ